MQEKEFKECAGSYGIQLNDTMISQFNTYADLLQEWSAHMNLTAIKDREGIYEKHFLDCMIPLSQANLGNRVADIGSGAGFPGVVWAIVNPEKEVVLIEPTGKRCKFLEEVKNRLQLSNVTIVNQRAEEYIEEGRETFDVVTARAVANLVVLSELCIPYIKVGGMFVALKGAGAKEEALSATYACGLLGCKEGFTKTYTLPNGDTRTNLFYKKTKATPVAYPRPYAKIVKKPLTGERNA